MPSLAAWLRYLAIKWFLFKVIYWITRRLFNWASRLYPEFVLCLFHGDRMQQGIIQLLPSLQTSVVLSTLLLIFWTSQTLSFPQFLCLVPGLSSFTFQLVFLFLLCLHSYSHGTLRALPWFPPVPQLFLRSVPLPRTCPFQFPSQSQPQCLAS